MNVKRISRRTLATLLSVLLLLSTLVVGTATTANAEAEWNLADNTYIYFDNSQVNMVKSRLQMIVITGNSSFVFKNLNSSGISNTSGTNLMYVNLSNTFTGVSWQNVKGIAFVNKSSGTFDGTESLINNGTLDDSLCSKCTAVYTGGLSTTSEYNRCLFIPSSAAAKGAPLIVKNLGGSKSADNDKMNFMQKVFGVGTVEISSFWHFTSSYSSVVQVTSNTTASEGAAYLTSVTIKATETAESGAFQGWYDNPSFTGTPIMDNTYTYTVNDENTYYAKFATPGYLQTTNVGAGNGTVSVSDGSETDDNVFVATGTDVTFTAMPSANYRFDGWYTTSDCTGSAESTDDPYIVENVSSAKTLYAKFSEIEAAAADGDEDDTAPTDETLPAKRNSASRSTPASSLSEQAENYYKSEVSSVDKYKDGESDESGVYDTFLKLKTLENNKDKDSFDTIYKNSGGTYDKFSGADLTDVQTKFKYDINNSLYEELYDIMSSTHTHSVSYPAYGRNSLAHYWLITDSSNINAPDSRGVYTFFYSNVNDFNHADMQREHIWPKSKASYLQKTGLGGSDLHHLRPSYGKVNNIKSNWSFGNIKTQSGGSFTYNSGWKNKRTVEWPDGTPSLWRADIVENGETRTYIDVKDDIRGDVARILLYIYTRWREPNLYTDIVDSDGNPDTTKLPERDSDDNKDTGEKIIQSKEILLNWMKNDPVSEWEMSRNDLTQDIQGNRNVFIDYPELAWLIFDENVPSDMSTPSKTARNAGNDITKNTVRVCDDPVTLDFNKITNSGAAQILAYDYAVKKYVSDGETVDRGDIITYTIIPDNSTITNIREFKTAADSGTGMVHSIAAPNTTAQYSFTKQAGYYDGALNDSGYDRERISVTLTSDVCEVVIKVNSATVNGGTGGSGSGMVTARIKGTSTYVESGDFIPSGKQLILTFTPDYGSRFYSLTLNNQTQTPELIEGTDTYTLTTDALSPTTSTRKKTFNIKFAQTFNNSAGSEDAKKHINNKGMRPDELDRMRNETDFTENFEICGVQLKRDVDGVGEKALRFVSVIDQKILDKAESYGYVIGYTKQNLDSKTINRYAYTLVKGEEGENDNGYTVDCTGTSNDLFEDYGIAGSSTGYKYVTAAVNNIQEYDGGEDITIIARPYVVLKSEYRATNGPSVIYGQYVDFSTGENFCACSGSYNKVLALANSQ